jgi:hypothetical protein
MQMPDPIEFEELEDLLRAGVRQARSYQTPEAVQAMKFSIAMRSNERISEAWTATIKELDDAIAEVKMWRTVSAWIFIVCTAALLVVLFYRGL